MRVLFSGACVALLGLLGLVVEGQQTKVENNGGHYRFSNIRWRQVEGNSVEFTLTSAWRRDYGSAYWQGHGDDGLAVPGDVIQLNGKQWPILSFGDETVTLGQYLQLQVTAYSKAENWVYGTTTVTHRYATPNNKGDPWTVRFSGCCKLSEVNQLNRKDTPWDVTTAVDLLLDSVSPVIAAMPVYSLQDVGRLSFYVPGFHPRNASAPVSVTLSSPATALTTAPTPFSVDVNPDLGKIELGFPPITPGESSQAGNFFFLKLNADAGAGHVQAEFLLRITRVTAGVGVGVPRLAWGHANASNLASGVLSLYNGTIPAGYTANLANSSLFYPEGSYAAFVGFPVRFSLTAAALDPSLVVGFGTSGLPAHARLSAVRGVNPSAIDFEWAPCGGQEGRFVTCFEAAAKNNASAPECVDLRVLADPPPVFLEAHDDGAAVPPAQEVHVTLGATKVYAVTASDENCLDELALSVEGGLPEGADLSPQAPSHAVRPWAPCAVAGEGPTVTRTLSWRPPHTHGGHVREVCFVARDACGGCGCAGGAHATVQCVTFRVLRCKFAVGGEHRLRDVGHLFGTDWLQIWKLNPQVLHPDYVLYTGMPLDIGRLLTVGFNDDIQALAQRFGTTPNEIWNLNHDLARAQHIEAGAELCILPDSCARRRAAA